MTSQQVSQDRRMFRGPSSASRELQDAARGERPVADSALFTGALLVIQRLDTENALLRIQLELADDALGTGGADLPSSPNGGCTQITVTRGPRCFYVSWTELGGYREREFQTFQAARAFMLVLRDEPKSISGLDGAA
jgi:hypothetical protein